MKVLVVSDDENLSNLIASKLIFLRTDDKVVKSDFYNAKNNLVSTRAEIVLVLENDNRSDIISFAEELKKDFNSVLIAVPKTYDSDFILSCIDSGYDDFIMQDADDFEFVIRIVKYLKFNTLKITKFRNNKILEQLDVIEPNFSFYTNKYAKISVENTIDNELITTGAFLAISPNKNDIQNFNEDKLANAIKYSIRQCDIPIKANGLKFYLLLPETNLNGAIVVYNKIKDRLDFAITAGIADITGKNYDKFEKEAINALSEAEATNCEYKLFESSDTTLNNWLDNAEVKNYKIFRKIFNKKLEKVITPLFYRLQQTYENKLFQTDITQNAADNNCYFKISDSEHESMLNIIYPGFSKIIISINHKGLDTPENKEIHLKLSDITEKELAEIIENFVKEFKSNQSKGLPD